MRLVELDHLIGDEIIAKDIVRNNGAVLLRSQTKYRNAFKYKLQEFKVEFVYVEDEISAGIEPISIISEEKRRKLTRDFEDELTRTKDSNKIDIDCFKEITANLVDEISGKDMIYDVMNIKRNDEDVYEHSIGVTILSLILATKMKLKAELINDIVMGALLHDVGKIFIPKEILQKKGKLDDREYEIVKEHPQIGYNLIKDNAALSAITKVIVLCHHEREDGSGYPLHKAEDLHLAAKIVACCDAFNAITSDRPYRPGIPLNEAVLLLRKERLNVEVREQLESVLNFYPVGTTVILNNGVVGIVEKNYMNELERPRVRAVIQGRDKLRTPYTIDLKDKPEIRIVQRLGNLPF